MTGFFDIHDRKRLDVSSFLNCFVLSIYSSAYAQGFRASISEPSQRMTSGFRIFLVVFVLSKITNSKVPSSFFLTLFTLAMCKVCPLSDELKAIRARVFKVSSFKGREEAGCHFSSKDKTFETGQNVGYFGTIGLYLKKYLNIFRMTMSSSGI